MAKKKAEIEDVPMELTPMIDVVFLLLIFFIVTIKFKVLEGKLETELPKDVGVNTTQAEPKEKVEIKIQVVKEGERRDPNDTDHVTISHENCLECGTCRYGCPFHAIDWRYPDGGMGVKYRLG